MHNPLIFPSIYFNNFFLTCDNHRVIFLCMCCLWPSPNNTKNRGLFSKIVWNISAAMCCCFFFFAGKTQHSQLFVSVGVTGAEQRKIHSIHSNGCFRCINAESVTHKRLILPFTLHLYRYHYHTRLLLLCSSRIKSWI